MTLQDALTDYAALCDLWAEANALGTVLGDRERLMTKIGKLRDTFGNRRAALHPSEHPKLGVHLSHCNFGEHAGNCKYGDDDCPAITPAWRWFGDRLQHLAAENERLRQLHPSEAAPRGDEAQQFGEWWASQDTGLGDQFRFTAWNAWLARAFALRAAAPVLNAGAEPIDMVLHCPKCGLQHVDAPEIRHPLGYSEAVHAGDWPGRWTNPPHRSHLCHGCGYIWRPADVPTNGVQSIKTAGKNDSPAVEPANSVQSDQAKRDGDTAAHQIKLKKLPRHDSDDEYHRGYITGWNKASELVEKLVERSSAPEAPEQNVPKEGGSVEPVAPIAGWKFVPIKATDEMTKAAMSAYETDAFGFKSAWSSDLYQAMVKAAPQPPIQPEKSIQGDRAPASSGTAALNAAAQAPDAATPGGGTPHLRTPDAAAPDVRAMAQECKRLAQETVTAFNHAIGGPEHLLGDRANAAERLAFKLNAAIDALGASQGSTT